MCKQRIRIHSSLKPTREQLIELSHMQRLTAIEIAALYPPCTERNIFTLAITYGVNLYGRKPHEKYGDSRMMLLPQYKHSAKKRDLEFTLTEDEFFDIAQKPCTYCGRQNTNFVQWNRTKKKSSVPRLPFYYTGIDRVDSSKGYTLENSVPCCEDCNRAKSDMSLLEFKNWITALVQFHKNF